VPQHHQMNPIHLWSVTSNVSKPQPLAVSRKLKPDFLAFLLKLGAHG
jgi:hypothetical protein